ncbi:MAG: NAD(P)/FAD-dependent oxidoreductase, partial [Bacteroidales bacterium]|nr:NAD(P)/FAD-dependent oxidoreductase [Bacteroidales bacterium]
MRIAVIGFGAAAIGLLEKLKNSNHEVHVFEKSNDIYSSSISGIRADGKLFVSTEMGGEIYIDPLLQRRFVEYYINFTDKREVETGNSFASEDYYRKFYEKGFLPISSQFFHIGTDQLKEVLFNIYEQFCKSANIHFHFSTEVTEIKEQPDGVIVNGTDRFDMAVIAVGRSGHKLINRTISEYP